MGLLSFIVRLATRLLQCGDADMIASLPAGKQPQAGTRAPPIGAQNIEQTRRQHRVAVLPPLPHSTWISFRSPSIEVTFRRQTSPRRSPVAYAVVSATRLRNPTTAS